MGKLTHTVKGPIASFRSADKANIESLKLHFLPKQEGSGDPSPTNIRPITGWTGCNLFKAKRNLLDISTAFCNSTATLSNGVVTNNVVDTRAYVSLYVEAIKKVNTSYSRLKLFKMSSEITEAVHFTTGILTVPSECEDMEYLRIKHNGSSKDFAIYFPLKLPVGSKFALTLDITGADVSIVGGFSMSNFHLEVDTASDTLEQYEGSTIPLSWSDHGIEYGGYIDPVKGKLVAEYKAHVFNGEENISNYSGTFTGGIRLANDTLDDCTGVGALTKCDKAVLESTTPSDISRLGIRIGGGAYKTYFYVPDSMFDGGATVDKFKQWLSENGLTIVAKLATPIEYDIDPISLQTFLDYNNFWTDMNDDTEVEYGFADRLAIRKPEFDTPHIETVSDIVATFDTDLRSKLVELKAGFLPKQEGSGDPSPTNVRPITGWTGFTLTRTNKNVLNFNKNTYLNPQTVNGLTFTKYYNKDGSLAYINIKGQRNANNTFYNLNYRGSTGAMAPGHYIIFGNVPNIVEMQAFEYAPDDTRILNTSTGIMDFVAHEGASKSWIRLQIVTNDYIDVNVYPVLMPYDSYLIDTINLSWTLLGEKYGGYVDLIHGKLVVTHKLFTLTGYEGIEYSTFSDSIYTGKSYKNILSDSVYGDDIFGWCSAAGRSDDTGKIQRAYLRKSYDEYGLQFYSVTSYWGVSENTSEAFIAKLKSWTDAGTPLQIVYKLATPIEYDLTTEQIKTFLGQNNIFTDSNGNVEVKYWTH